MKMCFMTFACPTWTIAEIAEAARRHGYQGVELRCDAGHRHGAEAAAGPRERADIRETLEAARLEVACLATSLQFADQKVMEQAPARVQLAVDLGAPGLRVFCGPRPDDRSLEDTLGLAADHLADAADMAQAAGVQLWLETHDAASLGADAAAVVRQAGHAALGVTYDNLHPFRRGEPVARTFEHLRGLVRHAHFHDAMNLPDTVDIRPFGRGQLPLEEMLKALAATGYDGYLSGEWFNRQYGDDPDAALAQYRREMAELAERCGVSLE